MDYIVALLVLLLELEGWGGFVLELLKFRLVASVLLLKMGNGVFVR